MDQGNIANQIPQAYFDGTTGGWWGNGTVWAVAQTRLAVLTCPTANLYDNVVPQPPPTGATVYGEGAYLWCIPNSTTIQIGYFSGQNLLGRTSYIPSSGAIGDAQTASAFYAQYRGPFFPNSKVKMVTIADGTSNTVAFGESLLGPKSNRQFAISWMGAGGMATAWDLRDPQYTAWNMYSSLHTGIVPFAYLDGTVKSLRTTAADTAVTPPATIFFNTHWYQMQQVAGTNEGQTIDFSILE
jgi:hypothetical protein